MGEDVPAARKKLDKFEKLVRDAIELLIKRGEIKIPKKSHTLPAKLFSSSVPAQSKEPSGSTQYSRTTGIIITTTGKSEWVDRRRPELKTTQNAAWFATTSEKNARKICLGERWKYLLECAISSWAQGQTR